MYSRPYHMNRWTTHVASIAACCTIVLGFMVAPAYAQPTPSKPPNTQNDSDERTRSALSMGVEEAIATAIAELDRMEDQDEPVTGKEAFAAVEPYLKAIQTKAPGNSWIRYIRGRLWNIAGRRGDAIDELRAFVRTREGRNEWRASSLLGDLFVDGFPTLARANYERAGALRTGEPSILMGISRCAVNLRQADQALTFARQAADVDGRQTVKYVSHLANVLFGERRWDEALVEATTALALAERDARAAPGKLKPLQILDFQYEQLVQILDARITRGSEIADDCLRYARYAVSRGRVLVLLALHDSISALERGIQRTQPDPDRKLLESYAQTLAKVGRNEMAIETFLQLLEADPENTSYEESLEQLRESNVDPLALDVTP